MGKILADKGSSAAASDATYQIKDYQESTGQSAADFSLVVERHHYKYLWTFIFNGFLGLWLIAGPHLFDYKSQALTVSDTAAGALIILFEMLAFAPQRAALRWCTPFVGLWLLFAPLIFWSPTPAVFYLDTLIGICVITFATLIPGMAGGGGVELDGPDMPPGWTYNPSSWIRRWLGIELALFGFFTSRYLSAHQLGYIDHAWDPFFGSGSDHVLTSSVSKAFPISDAGFGSVAYIMEVIAGCMAGRARWRTAPWVVVGFVLVVLPLGLTSIALVITQPMIVGYWCGLCLVAACALLTSVPLTVHEAIAVGQFLVDVKKQKKDFWSIFWRGATITGAGAGKADPERLRFTPLQRWQASVQGINLPWTLLVQLAVGAWLMARPDLLPFAGDSAQLAANCDHILGALAVTVAALATAEVTRLARYLNWPVGALLIVSAIATHATPVACINEAICGLILLATTKPRGAIVERYAGWDRFVK